MTNTNILCQRQNGQNGLFSGVQTASANQDEIRRCSSFDEPRGRQSTVIYILNQVSSRAEAGVWIIVSAPRGHSSNVLYWLPAFSSLLFDLIDDDELDG
jgi:hypothetical protein